MIDRLRTTRGENSENINSNTAPVVSVEPQDQTLPRSQPATLSVTSKDDGLPARDGKPVGMTASWVKYRGPGAVSFRPAIAKVEEGRAVTTAEFSEPGDKDFVMYANGPDWWIDQFAEVKLDEDRWIKAMEIKPSNPKIVHHAVVNVIEPDAPPGTPPGGVQLHEYAVGKYSDIFAENTGRLLKKGSRLAPLADAQSGAKNGEWRPVMERA